MIFGMEFPLFQRRHTYTFISMFSNFTATEYFSEQIQLMMWSTMLHAILTSIYDHSGALPLSFHACTQFEKTHSIPRFLNIQEHIHSTKNH